MNNKLLISTCVGMGLLAGCAVPGWLGGPSDEVSLGIRADVQGAAAAYRIQGAAPSYNYTRASIKHVVMKVYTVAGSTETPLTVSGGGQMTLDFGAADLDQTFYLKSLHPGTTYRIKAYAYQAEGTADTDLISDEGSSSVPIVVGTATPRLSAVTVPVVLKNRLFAANATGSVSVTDGDFDFQDPAATYSAVPQG